MNYDDNLNLESFELFGNLLSHMPLIFYILDKDWNFLLSNGQRLEKLGLKPGEVVGRNAKLMYQDNKDIIKEIESAYKGNIVEYNQVIGNLFLEDYIAPFYDKNGEIEGVFGASIDVTERKQSEIELEKTQALYEALRESIPGIIYIYNELGELIFWNKSHEILTGYSKEELDHMSLMDWYKDDITSQQSVLKGLEDAQKYGYGEAETNLQCKDGSIRPIF
ncbi:MAG: PAS domain S-box protein, partial [Mobilitalea sp.]